ncbi:serine--glyoxylate aminotransferase [Rosa chinensis]|uniref:serine--glyoxylate aminotransferase n=1 Tax=Rosa chinensis TaxID=74649 RepID=UPI000D091772|nr:serine--glyoxylate aminotransferase [Rosa chinensis]
MDNVYALGRNHLFVPGPVNILEPVLRAMNRNNEDYGSPTVSAMTKVLLEDVKNIFKTATGTPFMISTTGTGAWESALTNTLSPGDRIVSFLIGQFSLLWIDQRQRVNFNVDVVESEWGQGANLDIQASKSVDATAHTIKAVCIVYNETATGVTNNLATVRKILDHYRHPTFFLVDGMSSICALDFRIDEWGVDVALTGSQKALSLPTGIGIACASPKALSCPFGTSSTPNPGYVLNNGIGNDILAGTFSAQDQAYNQHSMLTRAQNEIVKKLTFQDFCAYDGSAYFNGFTCQ